MMATANPGGPPLPAINPDWLRKPSGEEFADAFPPRALAEGVGGKASISCTVTIDGDLRDCRVVSEEPPGYGFGQAALEMAPSFRMQPAITDGVQREGTVRIPIVFRKPEPEAVATIVSPFDSPRPFDINPATGAAFVGAVLAAVLVLFALNDRLRGRAGAPTAPLGPTIAGGFAFVPRAWLAAPVALLAFVAATAGQAYLMERYGQQSPWAVLGGVAVLVISFLGYGACYRVALRDAAPDREDLSLGRLGLRLGIVEGRILVASLVVGFVAMALALALVIVGTLALWGLKAAQGLPAHAYPAVVTGLAGLGAAALVYVWSRLFVMIPAIVHRADDGFGQGWKLPKAALFTSLVAVLVQIVVGLTPRLLPALALDWAGLAHTAAAAWIVGGCSVLGAAVALPLYVGLTSHIYLTLDGQAAKAP